MTAMVATGYAWQDVLDHRVELSQPPSGATGTPGTWDASLWDDGLWSSSWTPTFSDITERLLSVHSVQGAQGLVGTGTGVVELELLNRDGGLSPDGTVDWLLGRHVRGFVTPTGRTETPAFYGIIDRAEAAGTFALPTVSVAAYDTRSVVAAGRTTTPIANTAQTVAARLAAVVTAAGLPPSQVSIGTDLTPLLADDTLELGDLFGRTIESAAGLAWCDGAGRIVTRHRDWRYGTSLTIAAYVYAGTPVSVPAPGTPVAQTTELGASQTLSAVANIVTYANRAEPPVSVTAIDTASIDRYGQRTRETTDLASDLTLLTELAGLELALHRAPFTVCEGATVTVYDADTAAVAAVGVGDVVVAGRNDPGVEQWELTGVVIGVELTFDASRFDVALTITDAAGLAGGDGYWDSAQWNRNRWA